MTLDFLLDALVDRVVERLAAKLNTRESADDLLSVTDLVPHYFTSRRTLGEAVSLRGLVASRSGRTLVVRRDELQRYLAQNPARRTRARKAEVESEPMDDEQLLAQAGLKRVRRGG